MPEPSSSRPTLASVLGRVAAAMSAELSPGDVAAIRRGDPLQPPLATQKLIALIIEPAQWLWEPTGESDWAAIAQGYAILGSFHAHGRDAGEALALAGYSELRLSRLLRAYRPALYDLLRTTAKQLAQKGQPVDWGRLARLALYPPNHPQGRRIRSQLARDFFRAQNKTTTSTSDSTSHA